MIELLLVFLVKGQKNGGRVALFLTVLPFIMNLLPGNPQLGRLGRVSQKKDTAGATQCSRSITSNRYPLLLAISTRLGWVHLPKLFFGRFLQRLSRIKQSEVIQSIKKLQKN